MLGKNIIQTLQNRRTNAARYLEPKIIAMRRKKICVLR
jgi:hypothetical protein